MENRYWKDTLLRIQQLPMDIVNIDLLDQESMVEIDEVNMSESKKDCPLTLETLLGIFYKCHYNKPIITARESKDRSADEIIDSTEFE